MNIDPNTTVRRLVAALPSSIAILSRLGISADQHDERTLDRACNDAGIAMESLLKDLENIDWGSES